MCSLVSLSLFFSASRGLLHHVIDGRDGVGLAGIIDFKEPG